MPKHIRQDIKGTSFSVSVYLTLKIFITPWGKGQLYESWSEWEQREQSQHPGPRAVTVSCWKRDCQTREEDTSRTQAKLLTATRWEGWDVGGSTKILSHLFGRYTRATACVSRSEDNLSESVLAFLCVRSGLELRMPGLAASTLTHSLRPINTNSKCLFTDENHRGMWRCWWSP